MLRADMNTIVAFLKDHVRPTVPEMKRGYLLCNHAGFHGLGYNYPDLQRAGMIMGISIVRQAALADGHMDYYDDALNLIHTT